MNSIARMHTFALAALLLFGCSNNDEPTTPTTPQQSSGGDRTNSANNANTPLEESDASRPPVTPPPDTASNTADAGAPVTPAAPVTPPTPAADNTSGRPQMNEAARAIFRQGIASAQQNDPPHARESFEQALQSDPRAYLASYNAGVIAERQDGRPPRASISAHSPFSLTVSSRSSPGPGC